MAVDPVEEKVRVEVRDRNVTPTLVLLIISLLLNAVGLAGIAIVTANTNKIVTQDANTSSGVIASRIRNEVVHDCQTEYLEAIIAAVNQVLQGNAREIVVEDKCPEPLTETEIRNLTQEDPE